MLELIEVKNSIFTIRVSLLRSILREQQCTIHPIIYPKVLALDAHFTNGTRDQFELSNCGRKIWTLN